MILWKFPLIAQAVKTTEGLQRAVVTIPMGAQLLHLGSNPPKDEIFLFALVPPHPPGKDGVPKPYTPSELASIEFIVAAEGNDVPPNYVFRSTVRTPMGLVFLFEQKQASSLIIPRGVGLG